MDVPADGSTPTSAPPVHPTLREVVRSPRRRRPTGAPPPLPHHLQTSGVGWLVAAVVLVGLATGGLRPWAARPRRDGHGRRRRGRADGWPGCTAPGLTAVLAGAGARSAPGGPDHAGVVGLLLALLVLRRFRHLIVVVVACRAGDASWRPSAGDDRAAAAAVRGGPPDQLGRLGDAVGADRRPGGDRWSGCCTRWCRRAAGATSASGWRPGWWRWSASARMALGVDAPTDVLVGAAIGVTIPLLAFRWFTPNEVFPVSYRRGRSAHLDVGGARGAAIRRALEDQLGLVVEEVKPFGLAGSAGSTPLRITVKGDPPTHAVRQAVRPEPPARRPLVQARPGAAVRPAGGREAVQHRAAAGAAGGLRAVADAARRAAQPGPVRVRRAHPRAGVPAGHRVLRRRGRARRGRGRRPGHRRRPGDHPQAVGRRAGPPRHQAGQPAGPRRPACC